MTTSPAVISPIHHINRTRTTYSNIVLSTESIHKIDKKDRFSKETEDHITNSSHFQIHSNGTNQNIETSLNIARGILSSTESTHPTANPQSVPSDGDLFIAFVIEQIDQSLGIIRGDIHRVHGAAVHLTRVAARLEAAAHPPLHTHFAKAVAQTALFQTAIRVVQRVLSKHPLVDRQPHSLLAAASAHHRSSGPAERALAATALIHDANLFHEWP